MKKLFVFAAAAIFAAALAVSCQEKEIEVNTNLTHDFCTVTIVLPDSGTKLAISETDGKVSWEVGDQINIHGKKTEEMQQYTLKEEDISADGRSAVITFDKSTMEAYDPDGYYAQYPADVVEPYVDSRCYYYAEFNNTNRPLMAAYLDKETNSFKFKNLCAVISFKVTGDYDQYIFSGNNEETVGYSKFAYKHISNDSYTKDKTGPLTSIKGKVVGDGVTSNLICLPIDSDFEQGCSIKLLKNGEILKEAKTNNQLKINRNQFLALGDLTSKFEDYVAEAHQNQITGATNLGDAETANCYIITAPGSYKIPAVKGNSNESVGTVAGVKLLWETCCSDTAPKANSIIAVVDYEEDAIFFKTPETLVPGNALIAAVDKEDVILWSWHIWIPESEIGIIGDYSISKKYLMDRNLGAIVKTEPVANGIADIRSVGLYYEWGRKDPFVGYKWGPDDGAVEVGISGASGRKKVKATSQMTVAESIAAPTTFVAYKGDWLAGEHDNELWGNSGDKTIYDPCPAGYRVPLFDESDNLWKKVNTLDNFSASLEGRWWKLGDAVFPLAGCYDYDGGMDGLYNKSWVWSTLHNSGDEDYGQAQYIYWNTDAWASQPGWGKRKACGASVRCVKIEGEVPAPEPEDTPISQGSSSISIDGSFSDWADVQAKIVSNEGPYFEFKVAYDATYVYFYSKRNKRSDYWGNYGYFYYMMDLDHSKSTQTKDPKGVSGVDKWVYIYPFGGTNDNPAFNSAPTGSTDADNYACGENSCAGVIGDSTVEIEIRFPRADFGIENGMAVRFYSYGNKSADNIKDNGIYLKIEN